MEGNGAERGRMRREWSSSGIRVGELVIEGGGLSRGIARGCWGGSMLLRKTEDYHELEYGAI